MLRHVALAALAAAAAIAIAAPAAAQRGAPRAVRTWQTVLRPDPMGLLARSEVQNELALTLRQRNALTELMNAGRVQRQRAAQAAAQMRNLPPAERQRRLAEVRRAMQEANRPWQGELTDAVKAILQPQQVARLGELDLQRRGALALSDPRVTQAVQLSPETAQRVRQVSTEVERRNQSLVAEAFRAWTEAGQPPRAAPDLASALSPLRKQLDANTREAQASVLAALSPEETRRWRAALGKPFRFRAD